MNVLILGKGYIGSYLEKYLKTCPSKLKDVRIVSRDLCDYSTVAGLHDLVEVTLTAAALLVNQMLMHAKMQKTYVGI